MSDTERPRYPDVCYKCQQHLKVGDEVLVVWRTDEPELLHFPRGCPEQSAPEQSDAQPSPNQERSSTDTDTEVGSKSRVTGGTSP